MFTHARARAAGQAAERSSFRISLLAFALVAFAIPLLAGCTGTERTLLAGSDPSDPGIPVSAVRYRSTTASYVSQRPVVPAPWGRSNERTAPPPKSEK